jgi:hypothetical protein
MAREAVVAKAREVGPKPGSPRRRSTIERALADAPPTSVVTYDARYNYAPTVSAVAGYEEVTLISVLTGLANRDAPTALINLEPSDPEWLTLVTAPGAWLAKTTLEPVAAPVENLVARLAGPAGVRGVVLFDPKVTCSSAVANTAAGAENLLPIAFRPADPTSLYSRLVSGGPRLPVVRSLVGLFNGSVTGSVKHDCYKFAIDTFVLSGMTDGSHLAYYVDYFWTTRPGNTEGGGGWAKATIPNIDFAIARRGFAFDLCVWDDEAPVDEPAQPLGADLAAFRYILGAAYNQTKGDDIIRMHGFTPWAYKCVGPNSQHNHGGVDAEWATGKLISAYNTMDDGDACCIGNVANAAFYQHHPLLDRYVQPAPPSSDALKARGLLAADGSVVGHRLYYFFYAGKYALQSTPNHPPSHPPLTPSPSGAVGNLFKLVPPLRRGLRLISVDLYAAPARLAGPRPRERAHRLGPRPGPRVAISPCLAHRHVVYLRHGQYHYWRFGRRIPKPLNALGPSTARRERAAGRPRPLDCSQHGPEPPIRHPLYRFLDQRRLSPTYRL